MKLARLPNSRRILRELVDARPWPHPGLARHVRDELRLVFDRHQRAGRAVEQGRGAVESEYQALRAAVLAYVGANPGARQYVDTLDGAGFRRIKAGLGARRRFLTRRRGRPANVAARHLAVDALQTLRLYRVGAGPAARIIALLLGAAVADVRNAYRFAAKDLGRREDYLRVAERRTFRR